MPTNDLPEHPKINLAAGEGSFVRWQAITIAQLGYAVHLLLGFATAALGFCLVLLRDASSCRRVGVRLFSSCRCFFLFFRSLSDSGAWSTGFGIFGRLPKSHATGRPGIKRGSRKTKYVDGWRNGERKLRNSARERGRSSIGKPHFSS